MTPAEREATILSLRPIVYFHARRLCATPQMLDDVVSEGWLGAIDAVDRYDASRGANLRTYAARRIRGAMLDYLRNRPWSAVTFGRAVLDPEDERLRPVLDVDELRDQATVDDTAEAAATHVDAVRLLQRLEQPQREVLWSTVALGQPLGDLAQQRGVTDTRICQLRRKALQTLAS